MSYNVLVLNNDIFFYNEDGVIITFCGMESFSSIMHDLSSQSFIDI